MARPAARSRPEADQIAFFRVVLRDIRRIMAKHYDLRRVSIRPIGSDASRLSIPIKITGVDAHGAKVRYFGKILGQNDILSDRSMQFAKNLYLEVNAQDPLFGFTDTAEEMARQQFQSLFAIYEAGIPTARPFGYHGLNEGTWLLVTEFLDARPVPEWGGCTIEQIDTIFGYLKRLHDRGVYHGDIKPENIMLGEKIYILDTGVLRRDADEAKKRAYDLACLLCSFLDCHPVEGTVRHARLYYSLQNFLDAAEYIDLVQRRQDFHFTDEQKSLLKQLMKSPEARVARRSRRRD